MLSEVCLDLAKIYVLFIFMLGPLLNFKAYTSVLLAGETGILRKKYRFVTNHWQSLSQNVASRSLLALTYLFYFLLLNMHILKLYLYIVGIDY